MYVLKGSCLAAVAAVTAGDSRRQQATAGDSRRQQATASGGWQWQRQVVVDRWCQQKEVAAGNY
jgi:hypothetical protein